MGNKDKRFLTRAQITVNHYIDCGMPDKGVSLWWLGQAGFLIKYAGITLVIDAYLSDYLAVKYAGKRFPHKRMMPPPIDPGNLYDIDYMLCSHSHSDHMDPGLLKIVAENNPECRFIIPEAVRSIGLERGAPEDRILGIDAGMSLKLSQDIVLNAIPSAHEKILQDKDGHHQFLGFLLTFTDLVIYHPGDSIPYDELDANLEPYHIDIALMPVNGRSEELNSHGIAGNFNLSEALQIMLSHEIRFMIPHHFEMFDFNTVDRGEVNKFIENAGMQERVFPAQIGICYNLERHQESGC
jgi:L-ascorbate metabolism protein UlaG (beta-lactamase superfamily)